MFASGRRKREAIDGGHPTDNQQPEALVSEVTDHSVEAHIHEHHDAIAKRLKRAGGHLRSVVEMIETGRPCLDIAQQLHAVEKAVGQAKRVLIQDHLDHCLEATVGAMPKERRRPIDEFKQITKYL